MAKKKTVAQEPAKRPVGRPPKTEGRKSQDIHLRMSPDFEVWLGAFAEKRRCQRSTLIDQALAKLAELDGFRPPPKR